MEGARTGTRLRLGSNVGRPAESVFRAKVLPTSGDGAEAGLPGTVVVSQVLVSLRVSGASGASGLREALPVGVGGPDIEVVLGAGMVAGPSVLIIWMEGAALGLGRVLELQVLTIGVPGSLSNCCIVGDVVPMGRVNMGPDEGGG